MSLVSSAVVEDGLYDLLGGDDAFSRDALPAPDEWEAWVRGLFPRYVVHPMSDRHVEFWDHVWSIEADSAPAPFGAVWPRGGGKTTTAETVTTALGVRGKRFYAWYVSETQDKADKNVENIAVQLESESIARHYPLHSSRKVSKYGSSRGWRRSRLRTAGGFTIDAVGLETAARGLKIENQRPDLIVFDDVDGKHDTLQATAKKIATITTSILPAGSSSCAVIFVQNLIIKDGVMSRLEDGRADFLTNIRISGPHPAVDGLEWRWRESSDGTREPEITAGTATWEGQSLEVCGRMLTTMGPTAFLKECQHLVKELAEGIVLKEFDARHNRVRWTDAEVAELIAEGRLRPFGGIDYGAWRFAFLLFAADRAGRVHVLHEYFSQRETLTVRAKAVDAILQLYGIEDLRVYGDPANPTDATEMNDALARGWLRDGKERQPKWRTVAAIKEKGSRLTAPDRLNDMFAARSLLVRTDIGRGQRWHLGMHANHPGEPMVGSRFLWELDNWAYPLPQEGRTQRQDPDDETADGADAMAALRYGIMSWLKPAEFEVPERAPQKNRDYGLERMAEKIARQHGLVA